MSRASLALSVLVLVGGVARADDLAQARLHNERAKAAFALGRYAAAADEYEKAFEYAPQPALLYNAAQSYRLGGNKQRAVTLYQNYLRVYGAEVENRGEVEGHIVALKQAIEADQRTANAPPLMPTAPSLAPGTGEPLTPAPSPAPAREAPSSKRSIIIAVVVVAAVLVAAGAAVAIALAVTPRDPQPSLGGIDFGLRFGGL